MEYQVVRPARWTSLPDTKEIWLNEIIDWCNNLEANEQLVVYEFGENADLVLHIFKDEEYDREKDPDYMNIVRISTAQDGKWVDDTDDVYVTDGTLYNGLERIYIYKNYATR